MKIDVSLDVYKELTARLKHEDDTYSDVIREALAMDSPVEPEPVRPSNPFVVAAESQQAGMRKLLGESGFYSRGLSLPNGTWLRARYKQELFKAKIENDEWIDDQGKSHSSPSAAASAITGTNVNGLRFWEALQPGHSAWCRLDTLVKS